MILAIDIGNTNITTGVFHKDELLKSWRLETRRGATADEYGFMIDTLLKRGGIASDKIGGIVISSVVPPLDETFEELSLHYFDLKPVFIKPGIKTGMPILYDNPADVGADRIVNGVAAYEKYGGPVIVVDFGTATTFDVISEKGEYLGGAIAPGISISAEALSKSAARLPKVELKKPPEVIGKNTISSIQSGIFFGTLGMVEGIIRRISEKLSSPHPSLSVVATGGLSSAIGRETDIIDHIEPELTLYGLLSLFKKNERDSDKGLL